MPQQLHGSIGAFNHSALDGFFLIFEEKNYVQINVSSAARKKNYPI